MVIFLAIVVGVVLLASASNFSLPNPARIETTISSGTSTLGPDISCAAGMPANCSNADLVSADFIGFNLTGANFTGADLQGARFDFAILVGASLDGANLAHAVFTGANLTGAEVEGASLATAVLCNTIMPDGANSTADCS